MALRLINRHTHPLRIDLRGGAALVLAPGQRSEALREELLYDNCNLPQWERAGWVARVPARFAEVGQESQAPPKKAAKKAAKSAAKSVVKKATSRSAKAAKKAAPARRGRSR